jgi:predicted metal-binding integral membrane protein DUF2182
MTVLPALRSGLAARAPVGFGRWVAWHPEAWPGAVTVSAWWLVLVWRPHSHTAGVAPHHHAAGTDMGGSLHLAWWTVMVVAMMVPLTLPATRTVAFNSLWRRRHRAVAIFLLGYTASWVGLGAGMLLTRGIGEAWSGVAWHGSSVVVASALLGAAAWELTPWKRRALRAAHRTMPLAPRGGRANRDCLVWGLVTARRCAASCWPVMLTMTLTHEVGVMAALTGVSLVDRYRQRPSLAASAAVFAGLAVVILASTHGV